jgi:hypothetical protein
MGWERWRFKGEEKSATLKLDYPYQSLHKQFKKKINFLFLFNYVNICIHKYPYNATYH